MKGFLYKDLCLYGGMWKSYTLIYVLFFALTLFDLLDVSFLFSFFPILLCAGVISLSTLDEQARWDRFAVAVPGGRRKVVRDKYRLALLSTLFCLALEGVMALLLALAGQESALADLMISLGSLFACLLLCSIALPLTFRFGYQKARIVIVAFTAIGAGTMTSLATIASLALRGGDKLNLWFIVVGLALLDIPALAVSRSLSLRIYAKKDF